LNDFLKRVNKGEIIVADGAMGTMLYERGIDITGCVEKVNLESPEILNDIAKAYYRAGAEIIQTNTFGASPLKLSNYGLQDKVDEIVTSAVRSVRDATNGEVYISGSCGPSGKILKPYGDVEPDEMYDSFRIQMSAFLQNNVEIICVETMTDINEALLAIRAARELSGDVPIMATMTFDPTPRGFYTVMGVDIPSAAAKLAEAGANVIGSNCGNGIARMVEIAGEFMKISEKPVIIQSNAGLPEIVDDRAVYKESPQFMAEKAKRLVDIGVSVIGGCCGTTPEHIAAISEMVKSYRS